MIPKDLLVCEPCINGKMTKNPFIAKGHKTKECIELVHIDVCEIFGAHT